jgi:hypothetical protein
VLAHHPEWRGKLVLVQVTSAPRCAAAYTPRVRQGHRVPPLPINAMLPCCSSFFFLDLPLLRAPSCQRDTHTHTPHPPACSLRCRAPGKDVEELQRFVLDLVESINTRYRSAGYEPVVWLERPVPLYEKIALYSIAGRRLLLLDLPVADSARLPVVGRGGGWAVPSPVPPFLLLLTPCGPCTAPDPACRRGCGDCHP